ncbi:MAG TPA: transcriptional regulator [Nocardioidaceae bacterium]|nr:transcriptional regulator [Nocardioidaceae bacterium]
MDPDSGTHQRRLNCPPQDVAGRNGGQQAAGIARIRSDATVANALRDSGLGMSDAANAAKHGVAIKTIRRWRRLYQRQGVPRGQVHLQATCPRCGGGVLDGSAYVELLGWYLGDGHITPGRRGVYALHVVNDVKYVQLNARIQVLMRRVKLNSRPHARFRPGCVVTTVSWKHWPCLFPQHGPGRKHERELTLECWQKELIERYPADFLRGLFHSDGCRAKNWATRTVAGERKRYDYPRWHFSNNSKDIMRWCQETLDLLEIPWRQSSWKTLSVSTKAGVARLDGLIGLKN